MTGHARTRPPYLLCAIIGLGGLYFGVTGPLLSNFVPPLVRDVLGDRRTEIGAVLALDNVLMLLLVPWSGGLSDLHSARGRGRLPIILAGFVLSAVGMALLPSSPALGLAGLLCAMVVLYSGMNVLRAPIQALMADLVPSRYRSLANASGTFQMCVGAIVFLMLGRALGMHTSFLIAAATVIGIALAFAFVVREEAGSGGTAGTGIGATTGSAVPTTFRALFDAVSAAVRGTVPGLRAIFAAALMLQVTFQGFASWFALHGTERFGGRPEDMSVGFIAWALGGVIGALPAGFLGVRLGRRNAMLAGFGLMAGCFVALDRVSGFTGAVLVLALASVCWTLPAVNAYPLFIEPVPRERRGILAALFVLCMALGGAIGDPLNGALFDLLGSYRALFLLLAVYAAAAFVAVLLVPSGAGEADTGRSVPGDVLPSRGVTSAAIVAALVAGSLAAGCSTCRRRLEVPEHTYRETVTAFYTGLAAMQTGLEPLAREKLDRVVALVPEEPAGWANLGLLKLRQQDLDGAAGALAKAAELAPRSAHVQRLLALLESRKGRLDEAIRRWRRAVELDPDDIRARFALAQETERQGGAAGAEQAQRELEALLAKQENLVARVELARLAAKRGDAATLQRAISPLDAASRSWPEAPRQRLQDVVASASDPARAATAVAFLKNVLLPVPEFRRARAAVSNPSAEVGEPMTRFLALRNPEARPSPHDEALAFEVSPLPGGTPGGAPTVTALWRDAEAPPVVLVADGKEVRLPDGPAAPFPGGPPGAVGPAGVAPADLDHDYRTDIVLAGPGGVRLLRQGADGRFTDFTTASGIPRSVVGAPAFGAWAADLDAEGDLDVLVAPVEGAPVVLRNNGDRTFSEVRPFEGVPSVRGFAWADLEGDGVPDAALLDGAGGLHLFLNVRGGAFERQEISPKLPRAVAIAAAEASGDWLFDVLLLAADGRLFRLGRAEDGRSWETGELSRFDPAPSGLLAGQARLLVGDLDNNAAADLVAAGTGRSSILLAGPDGTYRPSAPLDLAARALADLDGDGRLEAVGVLGDGRAGQARSRGSKHYHWQVLRPRSASATGDQRINSFGVGGEVELRTGLHFQKRLIEGPVVHVGLGEATGADVVRILWPNGILQSEFATAADAVLTATQRLKGSCPWLFAWDGREMRFVTDLIWRSPLGLRINAQGTADVLMTEDWVKVSGSQLAAREGAYDLRVTAELWETHFFDLLSLLVVDHPSGTEVWVDERFAIPPPPFETIVTGPVHPLLAARDDSGRDVSGVVRERDGRHLDFAGRGAYQGVTRDHFVEVELPDAAPRSGPLWLLGTGWVHPTDSSINLAMAQGRHAPPRSLSLHVADARGRFREARSGLGFPSGKNKTVLLDLTGLFPAEGRRRARLSTNLEVFWDRLAWAVGRPDVHLRPRRLTLASADLRPRGFSVTEQADASSPEQPRYLLAGTTPRWLDLEGFHTRFGDVRELLAAVDDRYVIMNAGDEIRLGFPEAPPPLPGTVRDFVLVGDGWVKDGDFNTGFSRTVLPLPTHSKAAYDVPPGRLEDDPVYRRHRRDFDEYHTRYVTPEAARAALGEEAGR